MGEEKMTTITFKDTKETFEIMAQDNRYLICQRPYTVAESKKEAKKWDDDIAELKIGLTDEEIEDEFLYCDDHYELGVRPQDFDEDTFCYTIVDLQTKKRAPDNYYGKFNYDKKEECEIALAELNNGEMELSRRNSVELSEYEIKNIEPHISGFEVEA
jgi:hypothetical protein